MISSGLAIDVCGVCSRAEPRGNGLSASSQQIRAKRQPSSTVICMLYALLRSEPRTWIDQDIVCWESETQLIKSFNIAPEVSTSASVTE